jgi:hypothetical protein
MCSATPELSQFLVTAPRQDLIELASKLNGKRRPNRKLAADQVTVQGDSMSMRQV